MSTIQAVEIVVGPNDEGCTIASGSWSTYIRPEHSYGESYFASTSGQGENRIRWAPYLPKDGCYSVYVWYAADPQSAAHVPYDIHFFGGNEKVYIDQRLQASQWVFLGTFRFAGGQSGYVELSNDTDGIIAADAVRFIPIHLPAKHTIRSVVSPIRQAGISISE
jgi:hypothetical protein